MRQDTRMIVVNGKEHPHEAGMTLASLLASLPGISGTVVAEVNAVIVPRERFAETSLQCGDTVEIVHFVGGG